MANVEDLLRKQAKRVEKIQQQSSGPKPRVLLDRRGPTRPWQENLAKYQTDVPDLGTSKNTSDSEVRSVKEAESEQKVSNKEAKGKQKESESVLSAGGDADQTLEVHTPSSDVAKSKQKASTKVQAGEAKSDVATGPEKVSKREAEGKQKASTKSHVLTGELKKEALSEQKGSTEVLATGNAELDTSDGPNRPIPSKVSKKEALSKQKGSTGILRESQVVASDSIPIKGSKKEAKSEQKASTLPASLAAYSTPPTVQHSANDVPDVREGLESLGGQQQSPQVEQMPAGQQAISATSQETKKEAKGKQSQRHDERSPSLRVEETPEARRVTEEATGRQNPTSALNSEVRFPAGTTEGNASKASKREAKGEQKGPTNTSKTEAKGEQKVVQREAEDKQKVSVKEAKGEQKVAQREAKGEQKGPTNTSKTEAKGEQLHAPQTVYLLHGFQRDLVFHFAELCKLHRSDCTPPLNPVVLSQVIGTTPKTTKNALYRLLEKGFIAVTRAKRGRGGWTQFALPVAIYREVLDVLASGSTDLKSPKREAQKEAQKEAEPPSSRSSSLKTTATTADATDDRELAATFASVLEATSFTLLGPNDAMQLWRTGKYAEPRHLVESLEHMAYYVSSGQLGGVGKPKNVVMSTLLKGYFARPVGYRSAEEEAEEALAAAAEAKAAKLREIRQRRLEAEFECWHAELPEHERAQILKDDLGEGGQFGVPPKVLVSILRREYGKRFNVPELTEDSYDA